MQRAEALLSTDDLFHADAVVAFDYHPLTTGDNAVVDDKLDRVANGAVQLDDGA